MKYALKIHLYAINVQITYTNMQLGNIHKYAQICSNMHKYAQICKYMQGLRLILFCKDMQEICKMYAEYHDASKD
jgi:hypothetical protein